MILSNFFYGRNCNKTVLRYPVETNDTKLALLPLLICFLLEQDVLILGQQGESIDFFEIFLKCGFSSPRPRTTLDLRLVAFDLIYSSNDQRRSPLCNLNGCFRKPSVKVTVKDSNSTKAHYQNSP